MQKYSLKLRTDKIVTPCLPGRSFSSGSHDCDSSIKESFYQGFPMISYPDIENSGTDPGCSFIPDLHLRLPVLSC